MKSTFLCWLLPLLGLWVPGHGSAEEPLEVERVGSLTSPGEVVSGGSALLVTPTSFFVVRDNAQSIFEYKIGKEISFVREVPVFAGRLPVDPKERKKAKPDWEAALEYKGGFVLIPSGSKKNRHRGARVHLTADPSGQSRIEVLDFKPLYQALRRQFGVKKLNIEGAISLKDEIILFQRGNSKQAKSALIYLNSSCEFPSAKCVKKVLPVDLGKKNRIPYTFTDAIAVGEDVFFLAAAEETKDAVDDGDVSGSILGKMNAAGKVLWKKEISVKKKFEGIVLKAERFYLLSDPDKDDVASEIYKAAPVNLK